MHFNPRVAFLLAVLTASCGGSADPLSAADARYTRLMTDLAQADRDAARNIRSTEARKRKVAAESARSAFFGSSLFTAAVEEAKNSTEPAISAKLEGYRRHQLIASSWTAEEKKEEARLLSQLDELNGVEVSWVSPDGKTSIALNNGWRHANKDADGLSEEDRDALVASYIEHRMRLVGPELQALIKLRNQVAKRAGFDNYWELGLASQGLTPADVEQVIADLTPLVKPIAQRTEAAIAAIAQETSMENNFANRMMLRRKLNLEKGRDEAESFFDADLAEERIKTAFADMGMKTDGWQVYTGPSRYTRSGVYGFPIKPPSSVAIVMSNDRRWTIWQYEAIAHEGGHAVWWQSITDEAAASPPLWEPTPPWFEGFAGFFERLAYEPGFHARYVPELPKDLRDDLAAWRARSVADGIASGIVQTKVERRLYQDPNNLDAICRFAAAERQALTGSPPPPATEDGRMYDSSLLSAILWTYPAYSQNYLFSAMTEAWMWDAVTKALGSPIGNPKVGPLLKDKLIRSTSSLPDALEAMHPGGGVDALKDYLARMHVGE